MLKSLITLFVIGILSTPAIIPFLSTYHLDAPKIEVKLEINDRTQVFYNGMPCKFSEVPSDAEVESVEVAIDYKSILIIHFRTKKP